MPHVCSLYSASAHFSIISSSSSILTGVLHIGDDTRGYAAYFTIQNISIDIPSFLGECLLEGIFRFRYPEDIQLAAVVLSTHRKK